MAEPADPVARRPSLPAALVWSGVPIVVASLLFAARLVWEQTVWTWERGPQMVGFSLMHSGLALLVVLALAGGVTWVVLMLIFAAARRTTGGPLAVALVAAYALAWGVTSIPYGFWQRLFVERLAGTPRAAEFVHYAAATGDLETVQAFLGQGVPVDARSRTGATALHAAAVGGQLGVAQFLVGKGADLNAVNRYGDSPLQNAESAENAEVARFLSSRGAKRVQGTEAQRNQATAEIVREQMQELERRK